MTFKCFLKVAEQAVFRSDVEGRFQACGPATENALELADDKTCGIWYCPVSAKRRWKCREWYDCLLKVSRRVIPRTRM